jgi:hypothetical protein
LPLREPFSRDFTEEITSSDKNGKETKENPRGKVREATRKQPPIKTGKPGINRRDMMRLLSSLCSSHFWGGAAKFRDFGIESNSYQTKIRQKLLVSIAATRFAEIRVCERIPRFERRHAWQKTK